MPIKLADALVYVGAEITGLGPELDSARQQTEGWAAGLGSKVTGLLGGAVLGAATLAAGAVIGIGTAAFTTADQVASATAQARSSLGLTEAEAEAFGDTLVRVFGNNFGDSIEDVNQSLITVQQNMKGAIRAGEDAGQLTEWAIGLRDALGVEVSESTMVATGLMQNFGITGEEAFSIITAGMQNGLNRSGDLLDTLNEYSANFEDMGFTADQFLSTLDSGLAAGIYNTDKIADAFREFHINIMDAARMQPLKDMNTDLAASINLMQAGEITGVEAFSQIQSALRDIEDPIARHEAGVALMGSMWEDLGEEAILAIDVASDSLTNNGDVMDSLNRQYETLGGALGGIRRRALAALEPMGEVLLDIANRAMPALNQGFEWFEQTAVPAIENTVTWIMDDLVPGIEGAVALITEGDYTGAFGRLFGLAEDDPTVAKILEIREAVLGTIARIQEAVGAFKEGGVDGLLSNLFPPETVDKINSAFNTVKGVVMSFVDVVVGQVWPPIQSALASLQTALGEWGVTWESVWNAAKGVLTVVGAVIGGLLLGVIGLVAGLATGISRAVSAGIQGFIGMVGPVTQVFNGIKGVVEGFIAIVRGIIAGDWTAVWEGAKQVLAGAGQTFVGLFNFIVNAVTSFGGIVWGLVSGIVDGVVNFFIGLYARVTGNTTEGMFSISEAIRTGFNDIIDKVGGWVQGIIDAIGAKITGFVQIGADLVEGLKQGLAGKINSLSAFVQEKIGMLPGWVKNILGIASPSRVMMQIGWQVMEGLEEGIHDKMLSLQGTMGDVAGAISGTPLQLAGTGAGAGVVVHQLNINFERPPANQREGEQAAEYIVNALRNRGEQIG